MDAVGPALDVGNKWVCDPISRQLRYLIDIKKNYEHLKRKVDRLHPKMQDVNREISRKKATAACQHWLKEAKEIQNEWEEIEKEYQRNRRCLERWCRNILKSRLNLGKRIVALMKKIEEIENSEFPLVVDETPPIMPMPTSRVLEGNTSAHQTLQQLLASIKKPSVHRIGLWGMGGVGKTTIMKKLNDHPEISQIFEIVIWVTVSKEWTHRKVLKDLARRLKLEIEDGESDDSLKSKVFTKLKAMKFLLLLDDVWSMIDLEEVGVPVLDEGKTGCKVVLSTRDRSVCNHMRTDEEIPVKTLSPEEAWSLFRREVGEEAVDDLRIKELARKVAMECDGLPLAIMVIAGTIRKETDIHVWRNALQELRSAGKIKDMESRVYQRLKYSYDRLEDNSKECFLYCALFPEDWEIRKRELIQYLINEGLIDGCSNLDEAENKGFAKLKELIDASLLETGRYHECVKMHDVMRDLALRISSPGGEVLVKAGVKLSEPPKLEDWEKAKRISIMKNDLRTLPRMAPNCRRLMTLLLHENYLLKEIPPVFLEHMSALQVLNLSGTRIESLPPTIGSLVNLRGLYLNDCYDLKVIPGQIGGLIKLEIFQMSGSSRVRYLPPEIGDLTSLKQFQVTCGPTVEEEEEELLREMNMFPRLSNLSSLERLNIYVDPFAFDWWDRYSEGASKDISTLSNLTHLSFTFSKIEHFEHFVQQRLPSWNKLTNFYLCIGQLALLGVFDNARRTMFYNDPTWKTMSSEAVARVDALAIYSSVTLKSLSEFGWENMKELEMCFIYGCKYLETILRIDGGGDNGKQNGDLLPNLQKLILHGLPNLKSILKRPSPSSLPLRRRCFPGLTRLNVTSCGALKAVLSRYLIPHLSNLEVLSIEYCPEVEEIISMDEEEGDEEIIPDIQNGDLLPNLQKLILHELPNLKSILKRPSPSSLPLGRRCFPSLTRLDVACCGALKAILSRFLIPHLSNLELLSIAYCPEVEEIISMDEEEGDEEIIPDIQILFPRLRKLILLYLPKLRCICSNKVHSAAVAWPSLESVIIYGCENLKSLPHDFSKTPNLQEIQCKTS